MGGTRQSHCRLDPALPVRSKKLQRFSKPPVARRGNSETQAKFQGEQVGAGLRRRAQEMPSFPILASRPLTAWSRRLRQPGHGASGGAGRGKARRIMTEKVGRRVQISIYRARRAPYACGSAMLFPTTRWSILVEGYLDANAESQRALDDFIRRYRAPIIGLIRARGWRAGTGWR